MHPENILGQKITKKSAWDLKPSYLFGRMYINSGNVPRSWLRLLQSLSTFLASLWTIWIPIKMAAVSIFQFFYEYAVIGEAALAADLIRSWKTLFRRLR